MASLSAEAEQYIGTVGGGMDQAIIFLASEGMWKEEMCKYLFLFISVSKLNFFNIAVSIVKCNLCFEKEVDIKLL